jgi:hypothetical protein
MTSGPRRFRGPTSQASRLCLTQGGCVRRGVPALLLVGPARRFLLAPHGSVMRPPPAVVVIASASGPSACRASKQSRSSTTDVADAWGLGSFGSTRQRKDLEPTRGDLIPRGPCWDRLRTKSCGPPVHVSSSGS